MIDLIVAVSKNGVIGINNELPWHLPADLKNFKTLTQGGVVIMGRKTFESIGRPLPNRVNIVITRDPFYKARGVFTCNSLLDALEHVEGVELVHIIGGTQIFTEAMELGIVDIARVTEIDHEFEGDATFKLIGDWEEVSRVKNEPDAKNKYSYDFVTYKPKFTNLNIES